MACWSCSGTQCLPALTAAIPWSTRAGVLGMARTTGVPSGSAASRAAVVTPAAIDRTREGATPSSAPTEQGLAALATFLLRGTSDALVHAAVAGVGGTERPGQVRMARAVERAVEREEHLLVQAGTGTGKSLAYLVPAIAHAMRTGRPAVVAVRDGRARLVLRRETLDDLTSLEVGQ